MYLEDVCSIKRTDDGKFVISVSPPKEKAKKVSKTNEPTTAMPPEPKTYVANNMAELVKLIKEYVPSNEKKSDTDSYNKGFKEMS